MKTLARLSRPALVVSALSGVLACGGPTRVEQPGAALVGTKRPVERALAAGVEAAGGGQWVEAAAAFGRAAELDPSNLAARINQAISLERAGSLEASLPVYRAVLRAQPHDPAAAVSLARVLVSLRQSDEAGTVLSKVLVDSPDDRRLLITMAGVLRRQKRLEEAARTARKILLRDEKNVAAIKMLARIYADGGKLRLAETLLRRALELDDEDASIRVSLGVIAYRRGEHQAAVRELEEAVKLDPRNALAHADMGAIALRFRDYQRAARRYAEALELGLVSCATVSALGHAYEGAQRGEEAVEQLEKAYAMCPGNAELLYSIGTICMGQLRDDACAIEHIERYIAAEPDLPENHPARAILTSLVKVRAREEAGSPDASPPAVSPPEAAPSEQAPSQQHAAPTTGEQPAGGHAAPGSRTKDQPARPARTARDQNG